MFGIKSEFVVGVLAGVVLVGFVSACGGGGGSGTTGPSIGAANASGVTSSDLDGDGVANSLDPNPLDPSCATASDLDTGSDFYGSPCISYSALRSEYVVTSDSGVAYFGDDGLRAVYIMDLEQKKFLPRLDYSSFSGGYSEKLTALTYSNKHKRIYLGLSNGVILYSDDNETLHTFSDPALPVHSITEAGDNLWVQYNGATLSHSSDPGRHVIYDQNGNALQAPSGRLYTSAFAVWNEPRSSISFYAGFELYSYALDDEGDLETLYTKYFDIADKKFPSPLAVSPDGRTYITNDLSIHNDANHNRSENTYLPAAANTIGSWELIWTENHGLFMLSSRDLENTVVVQYDDDLTVKRSYEFAGRPYDLHVGDDKIYVVSHVLNEQMYVYTQDL